MCSSLLKSNLSFNEIFATFVKLLSKSSFADFVFFEKGLSVNGELTLQTGNQRSPILYNNQLILYVDKITTNRNLVGLFAADSYGSIYHIL